MDIKNKIQSEINDYQIKTTSQQILARFELEKNKKEEKKKTPFWIPFASSLSLACACAATIALCVNFIPSRPDDNPNRSDVMDNVIKEVVPLNDSSVLSQAGLQLFCSGQFNQASQPNNNNRKNALKFEEDEDIDININVADKEKRIKDTYTPLFSLANDFFTTQNQLSIVYGKTDFQYGGIKYSYVLAQGENKVYTRKDLNSQFTKTDALYCIGDETYFGFISVENDDDEEEQTIRSTFVNKDKQISIYKETEEDETSLLYRISDLSKNSENILETYKISTEFSKGSARFDECEITHATTSSLVKTSTEYDKDENKYEVEYMDMIYHPYSMLKAEFSFTIDGNGNLNYFF